MGERSLPTSAMRQACVPPSRHYLYHHRPCCNSVQSITQVPVSPFHARGPTSRRTPPHDLVASLLIANVLTQRLAGLSGFHQL